MLRIGGVRRPEDAVSNLYGKAAVRSSLIHFLFGKALNAIVSILTLIALARWMTPSAYGAYIAFVALQATLLSISNLGIDTTAERFLPELRTRHGDQALLGFVMSSMYARLLTLLILIVIAWFCAQPITALVGLGLHVAEFRIWVFVVGLAGMLTFATALLEAMLHQREAQRSMTAYVLVKLILIVIAHQFLAFDLLTLVWVELGAVAIGAMIGTGFLLRYFAKGDGFRSGWQIVLEYRKRMVRFAFFNYIAQVVFQFFNAEVMKLMVTRLLGVLESARYGFASSLVDTVQRYLPAVLLLRLIKPVFISRYTKSGDFTSLNEMARIILKLNLLLLAPIIAFSAVFGSDVLSILSAGKYANAHWLLVGALSLLVPASHQLVLSLLAGTLEKNEMQLYAGLVSTIAFPCALFLVPELGPLGAIAASAVSAFVYNTFATVYLRKAGFDYRPDLKGAGVFLLAGIILYGFTWGMRIWLSGWFGMGAIVIAGLLIYLILVRVLSAFSSQERDLLNSILPKPIPFI